MSLLEQHSYVIIILLGKVAAFDKQLYCLHRLLVCTIITRVKWQSFNNNNIIIAQIRGGWEFRHLIKVIIIVTDVN